MVLKESILLRVISFQTILQERLPYSNMQRHVHTAQERVNTAGLKPTSSAEPICRVGPWLAAGNLPLFYPTWSAEHLLSFLKSGISVCVAGRCSYITSKTSEKILCSEGQTALLGCTHFCIFLLG